MRTARMVLLLLAAILVLGPLGWGQRPRGLPDTLLQEVRAADQLPSGDYALVRAWEAEAAAHNTGHLVDDADAEGGTAWEAAPGVDAPNTLLYGPYAELQPGSYVAFFRLKLPAPLEGDVAGQLDACVAYAQDILAAWELTEADLIVGRYVQVPLGFRYERGQLECRLTWPGAAALRVDRVSLFRLEGADLSVGPWRAPAPVPTGLPRDLEYYAEPRPFPDVFPRSAPPAEELLVCDLRTERADVRLLTYSLQGLVNRPQPRLYCVSAETDLKWLEWMRERGWVKGTREASPAELPARFREVFQGLVVTDPALPASKNVATMLASVRDGLVASPRLAQELGLPVLEDLRGRWPTSVAAYRWAFEELWPQLNHHVIACSWPEHLALRDYLVQQKVFILWLSGPLDGARGYASPQAEIELMEELLAQMPVNIPVMSYPYAGKDVGIGEGPGVSLFAEFGKYLVGSIDCGNLSVHSGIPLAQLRQAPAPAVPALQREKVYLSFIISDGDNLPVLTNGNFPQLWSDPLRGQFPIGWTLSPSAGLLIPDVVEYYYRTATPDDCFLGAVSGVGYTYPDLYGQRYRPTARQRVYDEFLDQTSTYMERSGLQSLWVMNATQPRVIARFAERIPFLEALFPDYGRRLPPGQDPTYPTARNVPVFHAVGAWRMEATREERVQDLVADVRRMTPTQRPAFLHVFALNWFTDLPLLQEALQRLGPEYVAVRPDHLAQLWRQAMVQEQVLARFPLVAPAIEGAELVLRGTVRNMTEGPQDVQVRLADGLDAATVTPARVQLAPAAEATVELTGLPVGDTIQLALEGAFGTREAKVALRRIPQAEILAELPAARLVPTTYLEAETLAHRDGQMQADAQATEGNVWAAVRGETEPGYIVFGPYAPLEAGRYLALFRLKRTGEGAGLLAALDTCVAGGTPQTGSRDVRAEELPLDQFRWAPVAFEHPGGNLETRVTWSGAASLAVDGIAVWSLEPEGRP